MQMNVLPAKRREIVDITYEYLLSQSVRQSVFCQTINAVSDGVFKRKSLM